MKKLLFSHEKLKEISKDFGVNAIGAIEAKLLDSSLFKKWQELGGAADLEYLKRDASFFTNPFNLLEEARSIILFLFFYEDSSYKLLDCPSGFGRVARFAYGKNYHKVIKKHLVNIANKIGEELRKENLEEDFKYRVFVDAVPISERVFAKEAGLGFLGNSSMLVNPDFGTYFFIGEIVTNLEITDVPKNEEFKHDCNICNSCQKACVNKVKEKGFFDVNRCTSYLTIEKKGIIKKDDWHLLGNWIFGCDFCQTSCPFNKKGKSVSKKLELGTSVTENGLIDLKDLLEINDDDEFLKRYNGTSFMRAKRENIIRNSLIVIANQFHDKMWKNGTKIENNYLLDIIKNIGDNDKSEVIRYTAREVLDYLKGI